MTIFQWQPAKEQQVPDPTPAPQPQPLPAIPQSWNEYLRDVGNLVATITAALTAAAALWAAMSGRQAVNELHGKVDAVQRQAEKNEAVIEKAVDSVKLPPPVVHQANLVPDNAPLRSQRGQ